MTKCFESTLSNFGKYSGHGVFANFWRLFTHP
jgi:hypothetical protein